MNIVFLSDDFPPESFGGAGIVAFNLAKALREKGHSVSVITTVREKEKVGIVEYEDVKIYRVYSNYHERWRAYQSLYNPQTVKEVGKIFALLKPDIVHAHNIHYHLSYHCLKLAKKSGAKVFLTAHDVMLFHYGKLVEHIDPNNLECSDTFDYKISAWKQFRSYTKRYNPFRNIVIKGYLKYVDKIFTVSDALKDALNQNGIQNVVTIHNGISVREETVLTHEGEFKNKYHLTDKKVVLFGGRLSDAKGGYQSILIIKEVLSRFPNVVLLIMGTENAYTKKIREEAKSHGIEGNLIFTGWLSGEELRSAYLSADVVLVPSLYLDPFPTINLEAMAMKKPVVATCFGGSKELVQNEDTGFIINPFHHKDVASKILNIITNDKLTHEMGEAGYKRVQKDFLLANQAKQILNWYSV